MNNQTLLIDVLDMLGGLPFKIVDNSGNNIILVKSTERFEIISVNKNDTFRSNFPNTANRALNIENLHRALESMGLYIDDLDIKGSIEQQLFRELKYYSITESINAKEMSMKYQLGYRNILNLLFSRVAI